MIDWLGENEIKALSLSVKVGIWSVLWSLPFAIGTGFILARKRFFGHAALNALVHLPLILPPVVTGYLLLVVFGKNGIIGAPLEAITGLSFAFNTKGAMLAAAIMAFPLMVRAIRLAFEVADLRIEEVASTLGAAPIWVFFSVALPLSLPGILAGSILGFAKAMGEFGATITFVSNIPGLTQTLATAIYTQLQIPSGEALAWRLVVISLAIAIFALALSEIMARYLQKKLAGR